MVTKKSKTRAPRPNKAAADLGRSLQALQKLVTKYRGDEAVLQMTSVRVATMVEDVERHVAARNVEIAKGNPGFAHFEGPAAVVVYFQDDDAPDRFMHGEPLVERVVGPFKNSRIAEAWARDVEKLSKTFYEVLPLGRTPSPVPGADYYGGPVVRRVYDPKSTD